MTTAVFSHFYHVLEGEFDGQRYEMTRSHDAKEFQKLKHTKPNYPVPALREDIIGGGIKNHCLQVGATFVDVSRGELEIY